MLFILGSFIAGVLTVLAPCVLPLLPIIIGGSVSGQKRDFKRPLVITASLAVSLFVFTLLLKATTVLINLPPTTINYVSGAIIVLLGIFTLFPNIYAKLLAKAGIESKALGLLGKGTSNKNSLIGPIITGAALGPVFSSCSPVYGYILATVLPVNFGQAMIYITAYILGLAAVLLLIGYLGQRFISRISWMSNPKGVFIRVIGILFIIVGLLVFTGVDKRFQTFVSQNTPFNFDAISEQLLPENDREVNSDLLNVTPYKAPEFTGLNDWINSDPLTVKELKGKVVLVDFWTYSCINCIRNNPYIEQWYQQYKDKGFTVVGLHAPEFAFERNVANVEKAVRDQSISYPVALDNNFATWAAYENQFWPTYYLIDAKGDVRRIHSGEGEYRESEQAIRMLLEENGANLDSKMATSGNEAVPIRDDQTPETYMGTKRVSNFESNEPLTSKPSSGFSFPSELSKNSWALSGNWTIETEKVTAGNNARLRFNMSSKEAYFVARATNASDIQVLLDGKPISSTNSAGPDVMNSMLNVGEAKLYRAVAHDKFTDQYTLELIVPSGVEINVFTFGS